MIKEIGKFCRHFRETVIGLTLTQFSKATGENLKNIHAFEKGRANNIKYLYLYYDLADEEQKKDFAIGLFEIFKEV